MYVRCYVFLQVEGKCMHYLFFLKKLRSIGFYINCDAWNLKLVYLGSRHTGIAANAALPAFTWHSLSEAARRVFE